MAADPGGRLLRAARGSVRVRITSAALSVLAVVLLAGAIALITGLDTALTREVRAGATLRAAEAARLLATGGDPVAAAAGDGDTAIQILDPGGRVVAASPGLAGRSALVGLAPGESQAASVPFDDDPFLMVAVPAGDRMVLLGRNLDTVRESTRALATLLAIGLPALLALTGVVTWRAVGRALAPVDAMRAEVDAISAGQLHRRVSQPASGDEIGRLATTMNRMLHRVEEAQTRQRRFVSDASHELRSPIAAIRQHAEVALAHPDHAGTLAGAAHVESLRMQALVEDLLLLARADEDNLRPRRTAVDLDDLVLAEAGRLRATSDVDLDTTGVSGVRVAGDAAALRRVLRNLVDNAARHARHRIGLSLTERGGSAVLYVDDDGPGVPERDRDRVFERFVRLDDARTRVDGGSGLGLAIVAEVVRAHGGTTVVSDSPLGGARVTVRLPLPA